MCSYKHYRYKKQIRTTYLLRSSSDLFCFVISDNDKSVYQNYVRKFARLARSPRKTAKQCCEPSSFAVGAMNGSVLKIIEAPTSWCLYYFGEANASISELFSIASSSSLVGSVTGSFLKLKVITSLSS